jgi:DNA-directed RNA polymerase specialized sigma24 family protein
VNPLSRADSVLDEIKDPKLRDAVWAKFQKLYKPPIDCWLAARKLQQAVADDLTQAILLKLLNAPADHEYLPTGGRYRVWLTKAMTTTLNALVQWQKSDAQLAAIQGSDAVAALVGLIVEVAAADPDLIALFERVRTLVDEQTWAIWLLLAEQDEKSVAQTLGKRLGEVDRARRHVLNLLQRAYPDVLSDTVHSEPRP